MKLSALYSLWWLPFHGIPIDGHCHAAGSSASTGKFGTFDRDHVFLVLSQIDFVVDDVIGADDFESGLVHSLNRVVVAGITDDFSRRNAEEISPAVPLFTFLIPSVFTSAEHGFQIHA